MSAADIIALAMVVAVSFTATNLDNLILLVALTGVEPGSRRSQRLGFLLASLAVLALAGFGVLLGDAVDPALIGYMGLVPLALGAHLLWQQWRGAGASAGDPGHGAQQARATGVVATMLLMLGNSADSLAILLPLVAESARLALACIAVTYLAMAVAWITIAGYIAGHPVLTRRIGEVGEKVIPYVMLGAGTYILLDTASDTLQ